MLISSERFHKVSRIIEVIANVALVAAVVVGATVWLRRSHSDPSHTAGITGPASKSQALGARIVLPGVDWSAHKATLVVAISSACHYCVASTPFYSAITHSVHTAPIIVVMPQGDNDAQAFLRQYAITPNNTVSADLAGIHVAATPTLLLVSSSGIVTKAWIGELTNEEQLDVTGSLSRI